VNDPAGTTTISGQSAHSLKLSFGFSPRSCAAVSGSHPRIDKETAAGPLHGDAAGTAGFTGGATAAVCGPAVGFGGSGAGQGNSAGAVGGAAVVGCPAGLAGAVTGALAAVCASGNAATTGMLPLEAATAGLAGARKIRSPLVSS